MSDLHHKHDDCICDICIESYIELYEKIERLTELRLKWLSNMTRKERGRLNVLLKPKELKKKKS